MPSENPRTRLVGDVAEADLLEGVVHVGRCADAAKRCQRSQVLPRGQGRIQARPVDEAGDTVGDGEGPPYRRAEDLQGACVGSARPSSNPSRVVLPAPFGPTKPCT